MADDEHLKSLKSVQLPMEPACIEFCPAHQDYFVIGSWHLVQDSPDRPGDSGETPAIGDGKQKHNGSIDIYRLHEDDAVSLIQSIEQPHCAIWDLHFQQHPDRDDIFAATTSAGTVLINRLSPKDSPNEPLKPLSVIGPISTDEEIMITSVCWHPSLPDLLAISTLAGEVHLVRLRPDNLTIAAMSSVPVLTHTEPAWTVGLGPQVVDDVFTIYSGGDDSILRFASWSLKSDNLEVPEDYSPVKISRHNAGVVSITPLHITLPSDGSNVVMTGSYDDSIRVFAIRPPAETGGVAVARLLGEEYLGGGAWRVKVIELSQAGDNWRIRLLVSCMSVGSRLVEVCGSDNGVGWSVEVIASWCEETEGNMLNYGSDFQPRRGDEEQLRVVSTSFYSKMLYLWRF